MIRAASERWAQMHMHERIQAVEEQLPPMAPDGIAPSQRVWNKQRPAWLPTAGALAKDFCVEFSTLTFAIGYKPNSYHIARDGVESTCACGQAITGYRLARVGFDDKCYTTSDALIPLCDECAAMWDDMEASWIHHGAPA